MWPVGIEINRILFKRETPHVVLISDAQKTQLTRYTSQKAVRVISDNRLTISH